MKKYHGIARWITAFIFAVAVIFVYKATDNVNVIFAYIGKILGILSPFIYGFGLAFVLYLPSSKLENVFRRCKPRFLKKHARGFSLIVVYTLLILVVVLIGFFAIPALIDGITGFIKAIPAYIAQATKVLEEYTKPGGILQDLNLDEKAAEILKKLQSPETLTGIVNWLKGLAGFASSVLNVFMSFIISVYLLAGRERLCRACKTVMGLVIKPKLMDRLSYYAGKIAKIFYGYLYSQVLDACLVSVILSVGLLIMRVDYAVLLGIMVGMLNLIPYFGAIFGGIIAALIVLLTNGLYPAIGVAVFIIIMQQIDGNIIQPRIVGSSIGVRPIYVILAITIGGGLFGFWGIFLGVPVMATVQMLLGDLIAYRSKKEAKEKAAAKQSSAAAESEEPATLEDTPSDGPDSQDS